MTRRALTPQGRQGHRESGHSICTCRTDFYYELQVQLGKSWPGCAYSWEYDLIRQLRTEAKKAALKLAKKERTHEHHRVPWVLPRRSMVRWRRREQGNPAQGFVPWAGMSTTICTGYRCPVGISRRRAGGVLALSRSNIVLVCPRMAGCSWNVQGEGGYGCTRSIPSAASRPDTKPG